MLSIVNTPNGDQPTELREVEDPKPAANEALIEVRSFSVNRGELILLARRDEGWRPGQDVAGVVVAAAADGTGPAEGTRVVGLADWEGWAQYVPLPASRLAALPDNVTFDQAATLGIAGLTALRLIRRVPPLIGKRILVTGAAGGVGRFLVELAHGAGATVTAVVSTPERGAGLPELGARHVVTDIHTAPGPFDVVFESVGGDQLAASIDLIAAEGTILLYGNSSRESTQLDFVTLLRGHLGAKLDTFQYAMDGDPDDVDLAILVDLVATGRLHPTIGRTASWRDLNDALTALRNRQILGKAVLTVD